MDVLLLEHEDYSPAALETLSKIGKLNFYSEQFVNYHEIDCLIIRLAHTLSEVFLKKFPNLKHILSPTTGLTHIDLSYCNKKNIQIFSLNNCKDAISNVSSTSELTFGLILSLLRQIPNANNDVVKNGNWKRDKYKSRQLSRLSIGIIGLGRIGSHVAKYANSFGMKVLAFDPWIANKSFIDVNAYRCKKLENLLSNSDIITMHANLTESNVHLLDSNELRHVRSSSLIINTARGALINEKAVAECLINKQIQGIAVDVLESEHSLYSSWKNSPLVELAQKGYNVIITPHIGGCTIDAMNITEEELAKSFIEKFNLT